MRSVFEDLALSYLKAIHRRTNMIDQSVQNLHTVVTGLGDVVDKLSADVQAIVQRQVTYDLHALDPETKEAVDADVQALQQVAATLAKLEHALTPPAVTGATGA